MKGKSLKVRWKEVSGDLVFKTLMAIIIIYIINSLLGAGEVMLGNPIVSAIVSVLKIAVTTLSLLGISIGITNLVHKEIRFSSMSLFEALKKKNFNTFKNYLDAFVLKLIFMLVALIPAFILYYKYNGSGVNLMYTLLYIYSVDKLFLIISILIPIIVYPLISLCLSFIVQASIVYPNNTYEENRLLSKNMIQRKEILMLLIKKSAKYYFLALIVSIVYVLSTTYFMGVDFSGITLTELILGQSEGGFNPSHFYPKVSYMMTFIFIPILVMILAKKTAEINFIKSYIISSTKKRIKKEEP